MFSGGRDSTIAALRLRNSFNDLILVTVTSEHLFGIDRVHARLKELKSFLRPSTRWLHVIEPADLSKAGAFKAQTCLPCHHSYTILAFAVAAQCGARAIAFGYAGYQSHWPEQTPAAVERLNRIARANGLSLFLPVYDISHKDDAVRTLEQYGLTTEALEQKCLRQVNNVTLDDDGLRSELTVWEAAIRESLTSKSALSLPIVTDITLGEFRDNLFRGAS